MVSKIVARKAIHEPRCKEQARLQVQVYDSAKGLDAELIIESTQLLHIFQERHVGVINTLWLRS
jgi:hypothetical protein